MSKIVAFVALILAAFTSTALANNCTLSGTPAWSQELKSIVADCEIRVASPDRKYLLDISPEGQIKILVRKTMSPLYVSSANIEPPGMASWSPDSTAFFINDGQGSGLSSIFTVYLLTKDRFVKSVVFEKLAVDLYRSRVKCARNTVDPNVWGMGWSQTGRLAVVLIQATVNEPCGLAGSFLSAELDVANGAVVSVFSEMETKRRFRSLLPKEAYLQ